MSRFNKFFELQDKSYKDLRVISLKSEQKIPSIYASSSNGISLRTGNQKGGEIVKGQTIITKFNYEVAGKKNQNGKRSTKKEVGSHAAASLDYMDNHGAKDIENDNKELSNIYDESGERLTRDELLTLQKSMKEQGISSMSRNMIDIGQKGDVTREEYIQLVKDIQNEFMEQTGKNFDYKIAIHTDHVETGGNIHAHVLSYGNGRDISMNKEQLKLFKQISRSKTEKLIESKERSLKKELNKVMDKSKDISKTIDKLFEQNHNKGGLSL